jgi:hypothetical protein
LDRYARARSRAVENLSQLRLYPTGEDLTYLRASIDACGQYLVFRNYYTNGACKLAKANFCKAHLLCPLCAIRRGAKTLKAYLQRYESILRENPRLRLYLLTVTVKNGPDLAERHDHLKKAISAVLARRRKALSSYGDRHKTEWAKVHGLVGSYEVTNRGNGWHPHVHCLVLAEERLDAQLMKDEWQRITGDSKVLRIDPVRHPEDPARDFLEVFKYALKFSDLSPAQTIHAYMTLRGKHLLFSAGLFRGVEVPQDLLDDLPDDLPYIELFYEFEEGSYNLRKTHEYHPE